MVISHHSLAAPSAVPVPELARCQKHRTTKGGPIGVATRAACTADRGPYRPRIQASRWYEHPCLNTTAQQ